MLVGFFSIIKPTIMTHKEELDLLHKQAVARFEAYLSEKEKEAKDDHENLKKLKDDWEIAWTRIMETMLTLERLEI